MLPTSYDRQTESSYCSIQPAPSRDGTVSLCFVWIITCNSLYFVFELTICLLYHLQPRSGCTLNAPAVPRMQCCMHEYGCKCFICAYMLHAQIIYGLISVSCTLRPNDVISVWWYHICDKWTPLDYEQRGACTWAQLSGAHMWAWLSGARSRSPN